MNKLFINKTLVLGIILLLIGLAMTPTITGNQKLTKNVLSYEINILTSNQNNTPPIANFTYEPDEITAGDIVFFNDTSYDLNGTIESWWWQFGNGYYSDLQNCTHIYIIEGVYIVNLTVTDNNGSIGSIEKTLTILEPNFPPHEPYDPYPSDGLIDVDTNINLSWNCSDPDGDPLTYDVFFGNISLPPKVESNQTNTTWNPGVLEVEMTYYWQIIAWDEHNVSTSSPTWSFTTMGFPNDPPAGPIVTGPDIVQTGKVYTFMFQTIDPDEDDVRFIITWGDSTEQTTEFAPHNSPVILNHTWESLAPLMILRITITAEDHHGAKSPVIEKWIVVIKPKSIHNVHSAPTQETNPKLINQKSINLMFFQLLERLINRFPILERLLNFFQHRFV